MRKNEFIEQLNEHLSGNVSQQEKDEVLSYYRNYIEEEIRMGKSEQEVIDFLGSPSGIAKSVIEASGGETDRAASFEDYAKEEPKKGKVVHFSGWKAALLVAGIIFAIFLIIAVAFQILAVLIPILIPVAIVCFVVRLLRKR